MLSPPRISPTAGVVMDRKALTLYRTFFVIGIAVLVLPVLRLALTSDVGVFRSLATVGVTVAIYTSVL